MNNYHLLPEKAMTPHSSALAWKIPWKEEPGRLQSMGSLRVRHGWATPLSLFTFTHWRRQWQPTPVLLPGESQGRGSLVGCRLWGHTGLDTTDTTQQQQQQHLLHSAADFVNILIVHKASSEVFQLFCRIKLHSSSKLQIHFNHLPFLHISPFYQSWLIPSYFFILSYLQIIWNCKIIQNTSVFFHCWKNSRNCTSFMSNLRIFISEALLL